MASGGSARPGTKGYLMRTQKRFSPGLLARFTRLGRGTGTFQDYIPWHRVGRGDPSSLGRSHLLMWRDRQRELLSDGEWVALLFATMLSNVEDVREQHKLADADGPFELAEYDVRFRDKTVPGTLSIAKQLAIKHPVLHGDDGPANWIMTTDQLLVLKLSSGSFQLLAVAYKPDEKALTKRNRQLLAIEKAYWDARGVQWLLITPSLFNESVGLTLRRSAPWGLGAQVKPSELRDAVRIAKETLGHSLTFVLDTLAKHLGDIDLAQRAFWQAVWTGALPMDIRTGWRPHQPIKLLSTEAFSNLNPVGSRRSSWN